MIAVGGGNDLIGLPARQDNALKRLLSMLRISGEARNALQQFLHVRDHDADWNAESVRFRARTTGNVLKCASVSGGAPLR